MTKSAAPRALLPTINSEEEYAAAVDQLEPWLLAAYEICRREDIRAVRLVQMGRLYPTVIVSPGHVIKLYGRWGAGRRTYQDELEAYQLMAGDPGLPVPRYIGHGDLDGEWSYIVITFLPGTALSSVRGEITMDNLIEVAQWLGRFIRRLHSVPLSSAAREDGWRRCVADTTTRYTRATSVLASRGTLRQALIDEVETWMPPLSALLPSPAAVVLLHADLRTAHIFGEMTGLHFTPTNVIDFNRAQVGHPYYELITICRSVFAGDRSLMSSFLTEARIPGADSPAFPKLALAHALLHDADQLRGLTQVAEAANLDDLAVRLFGPA